MLPDHPADRAKLEDVMIDLSPLLRGARGDAILVAGVRVGEAARNINRDVVTDAGEIEPGQPRASTYGASFRSEPYRAPMEQSLRERRERFEAAIRDPVSSSATRLRCS